jgi:hypothetical protein
MKNFKYIIILLFLPSIEHVLRIFFWIFSKECIWIENLLFRYRMDDITLIVESITVIFFIWKLYTEMRVKSKSFDSSTIKYITLLFFLGQLFFLLGWMSPLYNCLLD